MSLSLPLILIIVGLAMANGAGGNSIDVILRGEPKSGTTYAEWFARSFLINYCNLLNKDLSLRSRTLICTISRKRTIKFTELGKHDILDKGCIFKPLAYFANCNIESAEDIVNCLESKAKEYRQKLLVPNVDTRFLLVLREPLGVVESTYFHITKPKDVSQDGLDRYVRHNSKYRFANIAARFIAYQYFMPNITYFWYHDGSNDENSQNAIVPIFSVEDSIAEVLTTIASASSSIDTMKSVEKMGQLPTAGARNGKVRLDHNITLSSEVREELKLKYQVLLPEELRMRWYRAKV